MSIPFHGDFHERIAVMNDEINAYPDSSYLYLKRANLYYQHEDFALSISDFSKCDSIGYSFPQEVYFGLAQSYFAIDSLTQAKNYVDSTLKINPESVNVLRLKAKIIIAQGNTCLASETLESVLTFTNKPLPINYYELTDALKSCKKQESEEKIYKILEGGILKLGELPHLYKKLVEAAVYFQNYNHSIKYQTKIIELSTRKEFATYQRALLHLKFKKKEKASIDFNLVLSYIDNLPEHIKNNRSVRELRNTTLDQIENLRI
jgi:tetratricopeptide (TPR) repeat protein